MVPRAAPIDSATEFKSAPSLVRLPLRVFILSLPLFAI
jgi:hypothetical protein